ncbi:hypothetical protein CHH80_00590 [Bacillus sp. 7504-2]|nr:hypothetical protein CHH80_00590 [Bacillus sp. 7504-2]
MNYKYSSNFVKDLLKFFKNKRWMCRWMISLPGYEVTQLLASTDGVHYYEGRQSDGKKVIIHHFKSFSVKSEKREWKAFPSFIEPMEIKKAIDNFFAVYEYFSFEKPLSSLIKGKCLSIEQMLIISMQLTTMLISLHQKDKLVECLNPDHVHVHLTEQKLYITSLMGLIEPIDKQFLWYSSPELTGRMEKEADVRSDLYSFGVVFYEMLTGQLPFPTADVIEIVYSHFTKLPTPPAELNSQIPSQLSLIALKLLEKSPDKRYTSAYSLLKDLERCLIQWQNERKISHFKLGLEDSIKIKNESKLFGREQELKQLQAIYKNVKQRNKEIVHIRGNSGTGKTALVKEFMNISDKKGAIFAAGKWDQFERNTPYGPIIQACKTIFRVILSQGDDFVKKWEERFLAKLDHRCQLLCELIPEFTWIIGYPHFEEKIGPLERSNSILITFQQLLAVLTEEFTVILFIDDIQWADQPTIDLLHYLSEDKELLNILMIIASRNEEEQSAKSIHNLNLLQKLKVVSIEITPLDEKEVAQWLYYNYHFVDDYSSLTAYVYNLSQGNPFFLKQILITLEKEQYISVNQEKNGYTFHIGKFPKQIIGKDIMEHIRKKLIALSLQVVKSLKFAACLGTVFTYFELVKAAKTSNDEILKDLYLLIDEGFICFSRQQSVEHDLVLEFIHDKVQQAVYTSMSKEEQAFFHFQIGLSKWGNFEQLPEPNHLFKLADHLNFCVPLLDDVQRMTLTVFNTQAGEVAKNAAAFEQAYHYFLSAKNLLNHGHWQTNYELSYRIFIGLGECAYLNSDFEMAESAFETLLYNAKTNNEKMGVYNLKLIMYTHVSRLKDAVKCGTTGLKLFGWKLDRPIGMKKIAKEFLLLQTLLIGKKPEELLNLAPMKNPEDCLIIESLINMNAPSYHVNQNLATYLMLRAFRFTLKHGNTDITALVYNNYALILSAGFGNFDKSYQFGKLALAHVERSRVKKLTARVHFVFGSFVNHWKNSISINLNSLEKSQTLSLESGNFHLAGAASSFIIITRLIKGDSLDVVITEINKQLAFVNKIQYFLSMKFLLEMKEWMEWLTDGTKRKLPPTQLADLRDDPSAFIMHNTIRLQMAYIVADDEKAREIIDALNNVVTNTLVLVIAPEFYFYHTLWLVRFYYQEPSKERKKIKKYLQRNLKKMKKWASHAPMNYEHKYLLMKIETACVLGENQIAADDYETALDKAIVNGFEQDAAIICECASHYYHKRQAIRLSNFYLKESYRFYKKWGAGRKCTVLANTFPNLVKDRFQLEGRLDVLDLEAVLKSSQTLSSEIVFDNLVQKVMNIVIENAGATTGYLLLKKGKELRLANLPEEMKAEKQKKLLPMQIIQYVQKSHESIILHEACVEGLFKMDSYIQEKQVMSLMTIPLLHQRKLIGILYLENHLLPYAFTERDLLLLSTIASQAAISIQNALLYMNLEEKVKERTEKLEIVNKSLEETNAELADAQKARMELLSNISHDLRNPITSIQGYIEAMLDGVVISPEKQLTYLKRSKDKLASLNRLIEDLFELSKLQFGNMTFVTEIVNVEKLFHYLCDQHEWDVKHEGLAFKRSVLEEKGLSPLYVDVDVARIEQVVTNIVSNALKHTMEGSIAFALKRDNHYVTFAITDTGMGISHSELEKVFERSYTGNTNPFMAGNGLGLSISKEIIQHHKGNIWAESVQGEGTTIFFTLPIVELEDETIEEIALMGFQHFNE